MNSAANTVIFANIPSAPVSLTLTSTQTPTLTAIWSAPLLTNGDAIRGYKLYIDDGLGGDYSIIYDGSIIANVYTFTIGKDNIECGVLYNLKVTAINYAGESNPTYAQIRVGSPSTVPLNLRWSSIIPLVSVTLKFDPPTDNGCLPITSYILNKDGTDLVAVITPDSLSYTDSIAIGGTVGTSITYKIKAINVAGESSYSQPLTIVVG